MGDIRQPVSSAAAVNSAGPVAQQLHPNLPANHPSLARMGVAPQQPVWVHSQLPVAEWVPG
jgi:hypothetical protein